MDTSILDKAIVFAVKAHQGVERKGKGFPYIVHPLESVSIAATMTSDQELLAAAVLHDTVEDTAVTLKDVEREFGKRVAELVEAESDIEFEGKSREESWRLRKEEAIERLSAASNDVKMVALSDKLSNIRAIYRDYQAIGDKVWDLFCVKDAASHEWHFRGLARALSSLKGTFAYAEFIETIDKVFAK
ncbi:MAG: bifunctional (p)ppGpp synthetase/guanosine-3',5'-bis(diphosphate) 3'-pyrophosphohydrolase [Fibrobacter sp.]|jgi:(p)ppGpp synthase/HD superfamily hydrolase|nr:bifunctional (p)ppGpp synthetase/guanosine-3',5'-bis(diphosphate) 3'-pyrophosphohydrolase [Fibrobacter sp.]